MKRLMKNKLNVQEMNLATIRNTNGGMLGAAISKIIKVTPKGVANAIDYSCKAYSLYEQVQRANNLPKPSFTPIKIENAK